MLQLAVVKDMSRAHNVFTAIKNNVLHRKLLKLYLFQCFDTHYSCLINPYSEWYGYKIPFIKDKNLYSVIIMVNVYKDILSLCREYFAQINSSKRRLVSKPH